MCQFSDITRFNLTFYSCSDEAQSTPDCAVYAFDMSSLMEHLRQQGEQNKSASYFNIDILKYQVISNIYFKGQMKKSQGLARKTRSLRNGLLSSVPGKF